MKKIISIFCLFAVLIPLCGQVTIDGSYGVRLDIRKPIPAEVNAEKELQHYLSEIFGTPQAAFDRRSGKAVILRHDPSLGREEFKITADPSGNVVISGGRPRGVMYGAYYFLDRKLGVHWYSPYAEYVPKKKSVEVTGLPHHGKPTFVARLMLSKPDKVSRRWQARNMLTSNATLTEIYPELGEESVFAPPMACHGLHRIIPGSKYRNHPEFFALINGKRRDPMKVTVGMDYCLTNPGLIEATIKECREYLKQMPNATYISIQEGDGTLGNCECAPCQKLKKECGDRESARWVYFANKVSEGLKDEFPNVKFLIFAYTASKAPPTNIKANDHVAVELCAWGNHRGKPYGHYHNKNGNSLLRQLKAWKEVCPNLLIWDYTYTFSDSFMQTPDMLLNIDNMKSFAEFGANGIFPEDNYPQVIAYGIPFKLWLLARAMWNPDECDGEKLEETFCLEYFGEKAGKFILEYYRNLRKVHHKQGLVAFTGGGAIGRAAFEDPEVTAYSLKLFEQALEAVKGDRVLTRRVVETMIPVKYRALVDYQQVRPLAGLKQTPQDLADDIIHYLMGKQKSPYLRAYYNHYIKKVNALIHGATIKATANRRYGMSLPSNAFDGNIKTDWHAGAGNGWIQIEFEEKQPIQRITTCFYKGSGSVTIDYQIDGSFDGVTWFPMVKRNVSKWDPKYYFHFTDIKFNQMIEAKYIRTTIYKVMYEVKTGVLAPNDVLLREQWFNLKGLPPELLSDKKP
ncbi:MAG: DUF4838 domain-containing protein [Lentisphaeria bacterium]|nr:DUF4838 domain-containing protein [Lentisphaeria bacterium]